MKYRKVVALPDAPRVSFELHRDNFLGQSYLVISAETKTALELFLAEFDIEITNARREK